MLLIAVTLFLVLLLPLITAGIRFNVTRIHRNQCSDILAASLPAAYLAISADELSLGRFAYDEEMMSALILELLQRNMIQAGLEASLEQLKIDISTVSRPEEIGHWLAGPRPAEMPLIEATATWRFSDQSSTTVHDRIELVLD